MKEKGFITTEESSDGFVGIRLSDSMPEVVFPRGFSISKDERERRRDAISLVSVLRRFSEHTEGNANNDKLKTMSEIPISSYQFIIYDFISLGYYVEKEIDYKSDAIGKIDWKRTIQKEKSRIDNKNIVFTEYQVKKNKIRDDALITRIHKYCVQKSFERFGWLFLSTDFIPHEPQEKINFNLYISTLQNALNNTFNDKKKRLFQSMINILKCEQNLTDKKPSVGVFKFETVWEKLVDYVFGEENKERFFPSATWHILRNSSTAKSSNLRPDTIMLYDNKYYILDAKYYKYGLTGKPSDLPATASIQKQITYGKYIEDHFSVGKDEIYNAFIMPYKSDDYDSLKFVSIGTADWEKYDKTTPYYKYVLGVLVDTKWLIRNYSRHNVTEIEKLAQLIEESACTARDLV